MRCVRRQKPSRRRHSQHRLYCRPSCCPPYDRAHAGRLQEGFPSAVKVQEAAPSVVSAALRTIEAVALHMPRPSIRYP